MYTDVKVIKQNPLFSYPKHAFYHSIRMGLTLETKKNFCLQSHLRITFMTSLREKQCVLYLQPIDGNFLILLKDHFNEDQILFEANEK